MGPKDGESGRDRLGKITNFAILGTLLFLLLNPSGVIGSWVVRQFAEKRQQQAVASLWGELTGLSDAGGETTGDGRPVVIEFLDYQCPACRAVAPQVSKAIEDGSASIVVRHLPLEAIHPFGEGGSEGGRLCRAARPLSRGTRSPDGRWRLGLTTGLARHGGNCRCRRSLSVRRMPGRRRGR